MGLTELISLRNPNNTLSINPRKSQVQTQEPKLGVLMLTPVSLHTGTLCHTVTYSYNNIIVTTIAADDACSLGALLGVNST